MELYIGGLAQGKLALAKEKYPGARVYNENNAEEIDREEGPVIWDRFHLSVRIWLEEGRKPEHIASFIDQIIEKHPDLIIIANENACGFEMPEGFEKQYLDFLGRLLIDLAKKADSVSRITCGIAQKLK